MKKENKATARNVLVLVSVLVLVILFIIGVIWNPSVLDLVHIAFLVLTLIFIIYSIVVNNQNCQYTKEVQENVVYLEKTKDAETYRRNFEEMLKKAQASGRKNTWVQELNLIDGLMACGEHDKADDMLRKISKEWGRLKKQPKFMRMSMFSYYVHKIVNDVFREDYDNAAITLEESREVVQKMKESAKAEQTLMFFPLYEKMASRDFSGAYEQVKLLQRDSDVPMESRRRDIMDFWEIRCLYYLDRQQEAWEKIKLLREHKIDLCLEKQLDKMTLKLGACDRETDDV